MEGPNPLWLLYAFIVSLMVGDHKPLDAISTFDAERALLTPVDGSKLSAERRAAHADFAKDIGSGLRIVGTRDFLLEDEETIVHTSPIISSTMQQDDDDVPRACSGTLNAIRFPPMERKAYVLDGKCRWAMAQYVNVSVDGTNTYLLTLYDLAIVSSMAAPSR